MLPGGSGKQSRDLYTVEYSEDKAETTLKIEGSVTAVDWETLREFCFETLQHKDTIAPNLEKAGAYDIALTVFVCLLRRTVQLPGKEISIIGKKEESACIPRTCNIRIAKRAPTLV